VCSSVWSRSPTCSASCSATLQRQARKPFNLPINTNTGTGTGTNTNMARLLLVPVLTLLVFTPPALSGWGASRQSNNRTIGLDWAPLTVTPGQPVELSMRDFVGRALEVGAPTVTGVEVRLTGFVNEVTPDSFTVVRYSIACCAADALASSVVVTGVALPSADVGPNELRWVSVTGTLASVSGVVPTLAATDAVIVEEPRDPYDS
jgi:uncharacterized repeat protein (TIGR03943 family)